MAAPKRKPASKTSKSAAKFSGARILVVEARFYNDIADALLAGASKVLDEAKVKTEGTDAYPKELVCRVNGVPAADFDITHKGGTYREECKKMPAGFAYWSLWVKPASGAWAYAQEGLATLKVSPGQSLELLFTVDGAPAAPAA